MERFIQHRERSGLNYGAVGGRPVMNILAVVKPESHLVLEQLFQLSETCDIRLAESEELAVSSLLEGHFDLLMVDPKIFFEEDEHLIRWIKFLKPGLKIVLL